MYTRTELLPGTQCNSSIVQLNGKIIIDITLPDSTDISHYEVYDNVGPHPLIASKTGTNHFVAISDYIPDSDHTVVRLQAVDKCRQKSDSLVCSTTFVMENTPSPTSQGIYFDYIALVLCQYIYIACSLTACEQDM